MMIRNWVLITVSAVFVLWTAMALADDKKALEYFLKGEAEYQKDNHQQARKWFEKAIDEKPADGRITITKKARRWVETAGGIELKKVVVDSTDHKYYPNARLDTIKARYAERDLMRSEDEKQRRLLAVSQAERDKKSANPPSLSVQLDFMDEGRNQALNTGEKANLFIAIENNGGYSANGVKLTLSSSADDKITYTRSFELGSLAPGESFFKSVSLYTDVPLAPGGIVFQVSLEESDGYNTGVPFRVATSNYTPPRLIISRMDVRVSGERMLTGTYTLVNAGRGVAKEVVARLHIGDEKNVILASPRADSVIEVGELKANQSHTVSFDFFTTKNYKVHDQLPFSVSVDEANADNRIYQELGLVMPRFSPLHKYARSGSAADATVENVDVDIPVTTSKLPNAIAFVIGNAHYDNLDDVAFALNDAEIVAQYLINTLGYSHEKVQVLKNLAHKDLRKLFGIRENAYRGLIYKHVKSALRKEKNPHVFIYYAGHGAPSLHSGKAYLVPTDAKMNELEYSGYALEDFYQSIRSLNTQNVSVVLDSCFSGQTDAGMLYKGISPAALKTDQSLNQRLSNAVIVTSAAADQVSYWMEEGQHSLFTYYFLKGLRGVADKNSDKVLTWKELVDYVGVEVADYILARDKATDQNPVLTGNGSRHLARLP